MEFTRQPVVSDPHRLTSIERYLLIDAYQFLKGSVFFPQKTPDITELEIVFLHLAYEHYKDIQGMDINDGGFTEGIQQLNAMDRGLGNV